MPTHARPENFTTAVPGGSAAASMFGGNPVFAGRLPAPTKFINAAKDGVTLESLAD
ncbi:hypothetical protein [Allorhodopirellula solitaria]|uniref:Uncharacterized protein n=1 Tax=Allorhodopirellula solitaria TaxID=2527987 RepID=A0A5C5YKK0_9BACT|nr:hypothetical protein [Allorhodopirellula solitaria]TWT75381.1 hypothetical protein CA85_06720 [Allorhodopirellula solitaria]